MSLLYAGVCGMDTQTDIDTNLIPAYNIINIAGLALLTLLVAASGFRCRQVPRCLKSDNNNVELSSTWYTAVASWVMLSITCCLLLGNQIGPPPPHSICLTQAVLMYASPTLYVSVALSPRINNSKNVAALPRQWHSYCRRVYVSLIPIPCSSNYFQQIHLSMSRPRGCPLPNLYRWMVSTWLVTVGLSLTT